MTAPLPLRPVRPTAPRPSAVGRRLLALFAWVFIALYGGISVGALSVDACTVSEEG